MSTTTTTWQARIGRQYQKLKEQLQEKRFEARSLFQQQRLLARLHRCHMQLRHLATGAVVAGSLLFGNAAFGQYVPPPFLQGGTNVSNFSILRNLNRGDLVDLDNDGDLDYATVVSDTIQYYENIGSAYTAQFVLRTGTSNPFSGIQSLKDVSFVDVDGDGDYDCFARAYYYLRPNTGVVYLENKGTVANPDFMEQPLSNNPLADVGTYYGSSATATTSFVDLDSDGDMDCFVSGYEYYNSTANEKVLYYLNQGSATTPNFIRQAAANNPLIPLVTNLNNRSIVRFRFVDMDTDNDWDVFLSQQKYIPLFTNNTIRTQYFENLGGNTFGTTTTTPLDSVPNYSSYSGLLLADIVCHSDEIDVLVGNGTNIFYENDSYPCFVSVDKLQSNSKVTIIQVSPNPTSQWLQFDLMVSGTLMIYNHLGQLIEQQTLELATELDLSHLPNGWYFLYCRTEDAIIQERIQIQH